MEKKTVKAVTRKQKYLAAIAGDGVAPSPITSDEKLMYNIAEKVNEGGGSGGADRFVVTLTPTSESGGTMNHTNAEILDAYMAGKTIMFDISLGDISTQVQATIGAYFDGVNYPSFNAIGVDTEHRLIHLYVNPRNSESDTFTIVGSQLLPTATASDNGSTLVVKNGAWAKSLKHDYDMVQPIPVLYNPTPTPEQFMFETEITIEDAESGYTLTRNGEQIDCPGINEASMTFAYVYLDGSDWWDGARIELFPIHTNADGITFQSEMGPLDDIGMTGQVGFFRFDSTGRDHAYRVHLCSWSATTV